MATTFLLIMVVDNLNVRWTRRTRKPLEADAPLIVDADAVLTLPVALQYLKSIAGQGGKICEFHSCFQAVQPEASSTCHS